jgi:hypothetical protein
MQLVALPELLDLSTGKESNSGFQLPASQNTISLFGSLLHLVPSCFG